MEYNVGGDASSFMTLTSRINMVLLGNSMASFIYGGRAITQFSKLVFSGVHDARLMDI